MSNQELLLSDEEWTTVARRRLGVRTGVKVLEMEVCQKSGEISGFLGDHIQVLLTIQRDGSSSTETLPFFVKKVPTAVRFHTELVVASDAFKKETAFYSVVVEQYRKYGLLKSGEVETVTCVPECYFTRADLIVQENLIADGFKLVANENYLDNAHCEIVLKSLAVFHAASIVLEEKLTIESGKDCKLNELYPDILSENIFTNDGKFLVTEWFHSTIPTMLTWVGLLRKYGKDTEHYNIIKDRFKESFHGIFDYVIPSKKYKNVFNHGDLWTNNIMFQYGDDEKTPKDVRFVDYQLVRYVPPAVDIMMFLHLTTSRSFRLSNLDRLLKVYHDELSRVLQRHSVDVHQLIPWADFRESCRHYSAAGRIVAPSYHHFNLLPPHVLAEQMSTEDTFSIFFKHDREAIVLKCYDEYPRYRDRVTEEVEELVECVVLATEIM